MIMTESEVQRILESNRYYNEFFEEFEGRFALLYKIGGAYVCFYNQVGGYIAPYVVGAYEQQINIDVVQDFSAIGTRLLRARLNGE